jgi:hypothetical protein
MSVIDAVLRLWVSKTQRHQRRWRWVSYAGGLISRWIYRGVILVGIDIKSLG